jgi:hypothetical protein
MRVLLYATAKIWLSILLVDSSFAWRKHADEHAAAAETRFVPCQADSDLAGL